MTDDRRNAGARPRETVDAAATVPTHSPAMRMLHRLTPLLFALAACSTPAMLRGPSDASSESSDDASRMDGARPADTGGPCTPGDWVCTGNMASRCGTGEHLECPVGQQCIGGSVACAVCRAGTLRCSSDPGAGELPQSCADDGNQWNDLPACNTANHETCVAGVCSGPCDNLGSSYLGCDYFAVSTLNSLLDPAFTYAIVVANPNAYAIDVSITGGAFTAPVTRSVAAGGTYEFQLPWIYPVSRNQPGCIGFPPPGNSCGSYSSIARAEAGVGAYHVTSNAPIAAYQFNPLEFHNDRAALHYSYSADASLLIPRNVLNNADSHHYRVVAPPTIGDTGARGAFVTIIGEGNTETPVSVTVNNTVLVVDPANTARTLNPGAHTFALAAGDVVQLIAYGDGVDITGTAIDADGPIAVFAGHDCVNVPVDRPACDHVEEQLFPVSTWGKHYAVTQLRYSPVEPVEMSYVRILSDTDGTHPMFDGISTPSECSILDAGEFCEFGTSSSFQITSDQPVSVTQFMRGEGTPAGCPGMATGTVESPNCVSDPAMSVEVPVEQYRNSYIILVPSTYVSNFVNVVSPVGTPVQLDGGDLPANTPIPAGSGFELHIVPVTSGAHTFTAQQAFGLKVYGVAPYTSYMYPAGLDLTVINPPG